MTEIIVTPVRNLINSQSQKRSRSEDGNGSDSSGNGTPRTLLMRREAILKDLSISRSNSESNLDLIPIRSNDIIKLIFSESDSLNQFSISPTYTHQLFQNEEITYLSKPSLAKITINIRENDLHHTVLIQGCSCAEEVSKLTDSLLPSLPDDSVLLSQFTLPLTPIKKEDDTIAYRIKIKNQTKTINSPPGKFIHQFTIGNENFELWLASNEDTGASYLLQRCEKMAMWFIETADSVNFADSRWEVLFLFRTNNFNNSVNNNNTKTNSYRTCNSPSNSPSYNTNKKEFLLAGYMTLFTFHNPFSGSKLRVCQALIMPYHQGKGLGREMLLAVYNIAQGREAISQITVEDPAPAFQRLRDSVDCEWALCKEELLYKKKSISPSGINRCPSDHSFNEISNKFMIQNMNTSNDISINLKLIPLQSQFIIDAITYNSLFQGQIEFKIKKIITDEDKQIFYNRDREDEEIDIICTNPKILLNMEKSEEFSKFRREIKKKILHNNKDLKNLTREKKLKELDILFNQAIIRFKCVRRTIVKLI
jgi:histone acetyltransferase 1